MGKLKITLTIANASGLYALAQPVLQTVTDSFCVLSDSNGAVSQVGDIENFQSTALVNQDLSWEGATWSRGYSVAIDTIVYEPNKDNDVNFFNSNQLPPPPRGPVSRNENVQAKIKNDDSLKGKLDVYTINFRIYQSPTQWKAYSIDPKLNIDR